MIRLDILSDIACPWCYLGEAALDRALEARPGHPFAVEWHPFELNPDLPRGGMDRGAYMAAKFGGREGITAAHRPLLERAEALGVEFDLPAIRRTPNTRDAHRLIYWAGLEGRQTAVVAALFRAYWRDGRDIGERAVLAEIAGGVGLDTAMVARLLEGDGDREEIAAREAHARERGVNAVPTFILANQYVLQGAQPVEMWTKIIDELREQLAGTAT